MTDPRTKPHDAASLLVLRDTSAGPEVYMMRRHPSSRFMANALVFVGGRLDAADAAPEMVARCSGLSPEEAARRLGMSPGEVARAMGLHVAAIRECFEECGLLLAEREGGEPTSSDERDELRGELLDGRSTFAALCERHGLQLPVAELRFFDRWVTPAAEPRRFDARFFVCRAPEAQTASADPREATLGAWFSAEEALLANRERRELLAPPTLTILERLRRSTTVAEILAGASRGNVPVTEPRPLPGAVPLTLLLPGDHRYHDLASTAGPEHYVTLEDGRWRRVCVDVPGDR
jgi:8-oxo-dGTP pyrophosphatase MutT (NUDIX family)